MRRLRAARRVCRTVVLRLRFADFTRATRSHTLPEATAQTRVVLAALRALLGAARPLIDRQGITLVGVALGNLEDQDAVQLALPIDAAPDGSIDVAVDAVRERFGTESITRGVLLGRDPGISMPQLPD
jgi:DNA polymerase-4